MTGSSDTDRPSSVLENAGESRHFSLAGGFPEAPGSTLTNGRVALLLVLLSTLVVVSFASVIENMSAASIAVEEPAPIMAPAPGEAAPPAPPPSPQPRDALAERRLLVPVRGVAASELRDNFISRRGRRMHNAIDIMAPRGTPVIAADDGSLAKVYHHPLGGLSIYQYDPDKRFAYYYAHMDAFAEGLREGGKVRRGDILGYVGTTGNATPTSPHLHFAVFELGADRRWWRGTPVNPFPHLVAE